MNREMRSKRIKLDDMRLLKSLARKGHYACSMDVGALPTSKDGYHACQIHLGHQKYMTIDLGESAFRASAGLAHVAAVMAQIRVDVMGMTDSQCFGHGSRLRIGFTVTNTGYWLLESAVLCWQCFGLARLFVPCPAVGALRCT